MINILLVEDEAVLAMEMEETLESEGYTVVGTAASGEKALELFRESSVDLLLCDISIQGPWDGIETVQRLMAIRPVPVIYLTALADHETIQRAKATYPAAYISKPYNLTSLRIAIELAINNFALRKGELTPGTDTPGVAEAESNPVPSRDSILKVEDHIFVKNNYRFVKISLADILYLEADNNYTVINTAAQKLAIRQPLKAILDRLAVPRLVRTHRSFAVNLDQVESFTETEVQVGPRDIPLGRNYKQAFLDYFNFS
ncbi:DNA-binding LytR/AlgR family response regulator [Lewinella marina]|uniref:DNA-binding response regulator n=1 Tax=Neolewinella marina TaxID=438751 RepID=A0A2G0CE08_9BACT|nr:response regulator [Neolewinella marina]NJB87478.1 DNA-binding LytR/AlgR family response regulator [Neolewinella marina]PHK98214.1 DNA-binding response regulator [Neolewinella marina]